MAQNEQVRIDLTANDKASRTIDDVADDVERLEKLDPEVQVTADDRASDDLADIETAAKALERLDPEVTIGADVDAAKRGLDDVRSDADALSRDDREIVLRAQIDTAKSNLAELRGELEQTADKADDTARRLDNVDRGGGSNLRGNAIADLTGPLGEASGAASDFAGVFDGIGDIAEDVAGKVGVSAAGMTTAIGGIGVAVAAGAAAWTYFKNKQEEARRKQRELTDAAKDFLTAYRTGQVVEATDKLVDKWGDMLALADDLGVSIEDVTSVLTGQATEVPGLADKVSKLRDEWSKASTSTSPELRNELLEQYDQYKKLQGMVDDAAGATANASDEMSQQDRISRQVRDSLDDASSATDDFTAAQEEAERKTQATNDALDRMRGALDIDQLMINFQRDFEEAINDTDERVIDSKEDVLNFKQTIIDTGEALKRDPWEIQTVLEQVDEGDLRGAKDAVEAWYRAHPVQIELAASVDKIRAAIDRMLPFASGSASTTVVNMTLPAGWRGDPVRTAHAQRRRTGRYFARG